MNKKYLVKWAVVPTMAASLMFSNGVPFFSPSGEVYAATSVTETNANKYAKELVAFTKQLEEYAVVMDSVSTPEEAKASLEEFTKFLELNIGLRSSDVTSKYGNELGAIHQNFDRTVNSLGEVFSMTVDAIEEKITEDEYVDFLLNEMMDMEDYATQYEKELSAYIKKHGINPSPELRNLAYGEELTTTYTVKKGDTLYSVAKKHDLTVSELKKLNNLKSDTLQIGQKLMVTKSVVITPTPTPETTDTYTVKKGDTLYSIAKAHKLTVKELKDLNKLKKDTLAIGQKLKVKKTTVVVPNPKPTTPVVTDTYTVKKGDTLYSIAKANKLTVKELKDLNKLKKDTLAIGQKLKVKKAAVVTPAPKPTTPVVTGTYTVKKGDTLYGVAKKHKLTVKQLKELNKLKKDTLAIGQKLKVKK